MSAHFIGVSPERSPLPLLDRLISETPIFKNQRGGQSAGDPSWLTAVFPG